MFNNKSHGDQGEKEIVNLVPCPNCGKALMLLPSGYPLYDIQCTGCSFRAQVKTNNHAPTNIIFGAGWQIMDKVLKAGFITPPTIVNFKWKKKGKRHQEIRFYPFVPRKNLRKYQLSKKARRADYWMFNYVGMNDRSKVPFFVLYIR